MTQTPAPTAAEAEADLYAWSLIVKHCRDHETPATHRLALRCLDAQALTTWTAQNRHMDAHTALAGIHHAIAATPGMSLK